jgi:hypothetical protein
VVREGDAAYAWRVKDRVLQKVSLNIGDKDARSGDFVLKGGVAEGDRVLKYPNSTLQNGQSVETTEVASLAAGK